MCVYSCAVRACALIARVGVRIRDRVLALRLSLDALGAKEINAITILCSIEDRVMANDSQTYMKRMLMVNHTHRCADFPFTITRLRFKCALNSLTSIPILLISIEKILFMKNKIRIINSFFYLCFINHYYYYAYDVQYSLPGDLSICQFAQ